MDPYAPEWAPGAFGLNNTGVICFLNSFLQLLAGCTSLSRAILDNADYVSQTRTGAAMLKFFSKIVSPNGARAPLDPAVTLLSSGVLVALMGDLAVRRPDVRFGGGQESASEALVHILDMMEPPRDTVSTNFESPITRLFFHRFRCNLHCRKCQKIVSNETDFSVVFNLFHLDRLQHRPNTVESFSKAVRLQISSTEDYVCPSCKASTTAYRVYHLTMVPEIIICTFNLYVGYGGERVVRYFPPRLELPATDGGKLIFKLVGQIEHSGSLSGGHYWARGLRGGGQVHLFNDTGVSPSLFTPTPSTYMVAYHFAGHESAVDVEPK